MSPGETSSARIRVMAALVILGTFLCGALVGAGLYRWARPHHRPPPMNMLLGELGLSSEQDKKAREIMERHRPELDAVLSASFPKVRAINDQIEKEVRAVLTPEQQKRLDELKARRPPHPPGGGRRHFGPPDMDPHPSDFFPPAPNAPLR